MNWKLYKHDDPNTWPKVDCPMVLYRAYSENTFDLAVHYYDSKKNQFYEKNGACEHYKAYDECYYSYIGYIPSAHKTHLPHKCTLWEPCRCADGYDDNGYCMYEGECKYKKEVAEYEIETKRIWKEFDENDN